MKLRNKWVAIDPREWTNKFNMTVTVGLGTGSQQTVLNGAMGILQIQQGMAAGGLAGAGRPRPDGSVRADADRGADGAHVRRSLPAAERA